LERMNALFREKETTKTYLAIVSGKPRSDAGNLVHWLKKDEKKNKTTAYSKITEGALESELNYRLVGSKHGMYLLEVKPITGRSHQIRVQLASMGCPIKGDLKYGDDKANDDGSICLHARQLEFIHPVKKEPLTVKADLPSTGYWRYFIELQNS
jgi:23S rRNA pseudouridine1911/1915/1917 synthase